MKVLVCIPCLMTGGTEIQTLSLVKALVAEGHRVVTACYFEHTDAMVERYRAAGSEVELLSADGTRPAGVKRMAPMLWRGLRRVVKQHRPDVAHVQYMAPGAIPIILLRLMGVKRIIATAHTSGDIYPSLRMIHWLNDKVLTAWQCITLRAEESFFGTSQLFGADTRLKKHGNHFTVYNCLPDYIQVREQPRQHGETITIGVVSRLESIKGMDLVVPAFAKVHAKHPNTRLLVVGDGSLRAEMERQAHGGRGEDAPRSQSWADDKPNERGEDAPPSQPWADDKPNERGEDAPRSQPWADVRFVGRQPQEKLQGWYDQIDILLMPSRSEGFGLTAIEGMARGCVPVVANTGGLPEVVSDGVDGLLHAPMDVDDIASKICDILSNSKDFENSREFPKTLENSRKSTKNFETSRVGDESQMRRLSDAAVTRAMAFTFDKYRKNIGRLYASSAQSL